MLAPLLFTFGLKTLFPVEGDGSYAASQAQILPRNAPEEHLLYTPGPRFVTEIRYNGKPLHYVAKFSIGKGLETGNFVLQCHINSANDIRDNGDGMPYAFIEGGRTVICARSDAPDAFKAFFAEPNYTSLREYLFEQTGIAGEGWRHENVPSFQFLNDAPRGRGPSF